jgi:hypothetical protein
VADHIIEGKGATYFGVAATLARIIRAIRHDERPDSYGPSHLKRVTGEVCLSLPRILGAGGVEARLEPSLTADEEAALIPNSAASDRGGSAGFIGAMKRFSTIAQGDRRLRGRRSRKTRSTTLPWRWLGVSSGRESPFLN